MSFQDADLVAAYPNLYAFCVSLMRDKSDAEDLAQDAVVKMLTARESFEGCLSDLKSWACKIAQNTARTGWEKSSRSPFQDDPDGEQSARVAAPDRTDGRLELIDALRRLDRINAKHRNALLMFVQGESYEDIAAAQGFASVVTAKTAVFKARYGLTCEPVICPQCGVSFVPERQEQRVCGVACGGQRGGQRASQGFACETVDGVTAWSVHY